MDHPPSPSDQARSKAAIAGRLRLIRSEIFGEHGGPKLADQLMVPSRTWSNYESGVTIPGEILLRFLAITDTEPLWLLGGEGPKHRTREHPASETPGTHGGQDHLLKREA
jgi:hypothetical protein